MKNEIFRENVIIITGASLGIGRQLALKYAELGAWLSLASRNTEKLKEISEECLQRGGRAIMIPTDVTDQLMCQNLIEGTVKEYGRIDTLINNAGLGMASRFDELQDLIIFEKVFKANFFGCVYCTYYALPYLKKTQGRLVGISSLRGIFPSATADAYGPSKHAMKGFLDCLRVELAGTGVSVTTIFPGWVSTGISSRALNADGSLTEKISIHEENAMSVDKCAQTILKAIAKRKREVVMTFQGKFGQWGILIAPKVIDEIVRKDTSIDN
jgi:short-subunit dehydrogenase